MNQPRTVVLHHDVGIGDIIFHLELFRAIAAQSANGQISLIARPTCRAEDLLRHEPWLEQVIIYDRGRRHEGGHGRHRGIGGMLRFAHELAGHRFERMVILSDRIRYALQGKLAGIPERIGFGGFDWNYPQRLFLSKGPFIQKYDNICVNNYIQSVHLLLAHGFLNDWPKPPQLGIPDALMQKWAAALTTLPTPRLALIIGASVKNKDWGLARYLELAHALLQRGCGVLILGGPQETAMLEQARRTLAEHRGAMVLQPPTLLDAGAILRQAQCAIGNDTGVSNLSAAVGTPTFVLLGHRPILCHDPRIRCLIKGGLTTITPDDVLIALEQQACPWPSAS